MNLIYYIYAIASDLWRDPYLLGEGTDIVHRIVGGCIQLVYAVGAVFIEGQTGFALIAGFAFRGDVLAVDGLGENPGTGSLSHTPGAAEQVSVAQEIVLNGIAQGGGDGGLSHYISETRWSVFPGRYNEFVHKRMLR